MEIHSSRKMYVETERDWMRLRRQWKPLCANIKLYRESERD